MRSFDDFQKEYTADGEKSYLTLSIPVDKQLKQYQIGMLEKNRLDLLLPLVVQRVNDDWKLSCDITSKIPLGRILERKSLRHHEFVFIIRQFAELVHVLKEYLLDLPCAVFDKNFIFCDPAEFALYFIYIPVKSSEREPERIKNFLRKLIVEDIHLVDDVSGSLLKKLLEALKSETFTSELLYQCLDGTDIHKEAHRGTGGNEHTSDATEPKEESGSQAFISDVQFVTAPRPDNSLGGGKRDGNRSPQQQNNHYSPRTNRQDTPPSKANRIGKTPPNDPLKMVRNPETISSQNSGVHPLKSGNHLFAFLRKYPKLSWLIAGGVNLLLVGILVYIIASYEKNPGNAVSNIAGFLLITAAGNYFLLTRLFSKDKRIPDVEVPNTLWGASFNKRFHPVNGDEDIILPKNPAARFRGENYREKVELPPVSQATVSSANHAVPGSYKAQTGSNQEVNPVVGKNQENNRKLNQKEQVFETATNRTAFTDLNIESEIDKTYHQAAFTQSEEQITTLHTTAGNGNLPSKEAVCSKAAIQNSLHGIIEPVRPQGCSGEYYSDFHASDIRREANQSFPDKTMILGSPSQQVPCLVSLLRPYEKILLDKTPLMIGRLADSVDYVIQNRAIGKIHAEIIKSGDNYYIVDLNSVNGTYVNGERLICNTETLMNSGDKVTLANESYTYFHGGQVPVQI